MIDIKAAIAALVEQSGMTQEGIAEYIGISQSRVSQIVNSSRCHEMSYQKTLKLERLCLLHGVKIEQQKTPTA